jgi:hypothetical protein
MSSWALQLKSLLPKQDQALKFFQVNPMSIFINYHLVVFPSCFLSYEP